ncbi:hypothetical protein BC826DRAFT_1109275 [Russula brevipes]|nr:hypothetical protein BC826DRAFT_1109275 [Russula brevipes]
MSATQDEDIFQTAHVINCPQFGTPVPLSNATSKCSINSVVEAVDFALGSHPHIPVANPFPAVIPPVLHRLRSPTPLEALASRPFSDVTEKPLLLCVADPSAALGLMYLRTESQEVADILTIPEMTMALNRIPPNLLLLRMLARNLILWGRITY